MLLKRRPNDLETPFILKRVPHRQKRRSSAGNRALAHVPPIDLSSLAPSDASARRQGVQPRDSRGSGACDGAFARRCRLRTGLQRSAAVVELNLLDAKPTDSGRSLPQRFSARRLGAYPQGSGHSAPVQSLMLRQSMPWARVCPGQPARHHLAAGAPQGYLAVTSTANCQEPAARQRLPCALCSSCPSICVAISSWPFLFGCMSSVYQPAWSRSTWIGTDIGREGLAL